jgi:hypothetical protein
MASIEKNTANTTGPANNWGDDAVESNHPSSTNHRSMSPTIIGRPSLDIPAGSAGRDQQRPVREVDPEALLQADAFYNRYKSACHGMTRRPELQRLFEDTFPSWAYPNAPHVDFGKVLFALAHGMKMVRVVDGGRQLIWKVFREHHHQHDERAPPRDDRRPRDDRAPPRDFHGPRDDRRPRDDCAPPREFRGPVDDRRPRDDRAPRDDRGPRDDRAPRDDRRPRDDRETRGPFVHHERADRIPRDDREQEHHQKRPNLAEIVSNQQKMIDTLMSKMMKMDQ